MKLYPSSTAFQEGGLVFTRYSSGCHRTILLRHHGVKDEIAQKYKVIGALNEDWFEERLKGLPYSREVPVNFVVSNNPMAVLSGRVDYIMYPDDPIRKELVELKSSISNSVGKDVIKDGKISLQNLAQVVCYMLAQECNNARLVYAFYKQDKKSKVFKKESEREFKIAVKDGGRILVDSEENGFTVQNVLQHLNAAVNHINNGTLAERPYGGDSFDGPCKFCTFNTACSLVTSGVINSLEEFIDYSKILVTKKKEKTLNALPKFDFSKVNLDDASLNKMMEDNAPKKDDRFKPGSYEVQIIKSEYKGQASDETWAKWEVTYEGTGNKTIRTTHLVPTSKLTYTDRNGKEGTFAIEKLKGFLEALGVAFSVKALGETLPRYFGANDQLVGLNVGIDCGYQGSHLKYLGKTEEDKPRLAIVYRSGDVIEGHPEFESYKMGQEYAEKNNIKLTFVDVLSYAESSVGNKKTDANW